jgi:hypothetical protein
MHGWFEPPPGLGKYREVVSAMVRAGAEVDSDWLGAEPVQADPQKLGTTWRILIRVEIFEDGLADTIRPRVDVFGDPSRIYALQGSTRTSLLGRLPRLCRQNEMVNGCDLPGFTCKRCM